MTEGAHDASYVRHRSYRDVFFGCSCLLKRLTLSFQERVWRQTNAFFGERARQELGTVEEGGTQSKILKFMNSWTDVFVAFR